MTLIVRLSVGTPNSDHGNAGGRVRGEINNLRTVRIEGFPVAVIGDKLTSHGDHNANFIITGSPTVKAYGLGVVRTGDTAHCGHFLISGAIKTYAG